MTDTDDIEKLRRILSTSRTIAMVGLSDKSHRPSFFAAKYLQEHGFRVVPVNPSCTEILGEKCYASLEEIPEPVDMVDCFRAASEMVGLAEQAIKIKAPVLWMQLTIVNQEAKKLAEHAGLEVVMDRCTKIEHARIFGGLNFAGVNTGIISARRPRHGR